MSKIKYNNYSLLAIATLFAIASAYFSEIILALKPCILCIYQRIPYFLLIILGFLGHFSEKSHKISFYLVIILLVIEILLAGYHVGVEHYIFADNYICQAASNMNALSTVNLASSCSQVSFRFMNLSMAEWNLLYSSLLLYYFIIREKK